MSEFYEYSCGPADELIERSFKGLASFLKLLPYGDALRAVGLALAAGDTV